MDQKTSQSQAKILKPSPNEEETIIRHALAERRKQRLLQVRKQEKSLSGKICNIVRKKREEEMTNFRLQQERERNKKLSKEIEELETEYRSRIENLGEGHKAADEIPIKASTQVSQAMKQRTLQRYEEALKKLEEHKTALKKPEEEKAMLRQKVALTEKSRASVIASKPAPIQDFVVDIDRVNRHATFSTRTKVTDSFGSSRFHMPQVYAEKANGQAQVDARNTARNFEERIKQGRELLEKDLNERNEKANLRHQHARQQVLLDQSKERLLEQLDELEFKDRVRRQQVLSKIPKQVFQPPYQRVEDAKAKQTVLEEAFENAHLTNKNVHENELVLDLKDELEALERDLAQHESLRQDLDIQSNKSSMESRTQAQQEPKTDAAPSAPMAAVKAADPSKRMQKLLGRIRQQQDEWSKQNANKRMDKLVEDEQIRREESSESLVSADIDSARYTNSNTESTENGGKAESIMKEEESSENDKHTQDTPDNENLLFHPFEKAKLIRSAGKKQDEYVENQGLTSSTSLDLDERKKTLENQKYLFKIQKQRLENQLLRRDLQTTEKALGLLVEEDGMGVFNISNRQGSLSKFSSPSAAEEDGHKTNQSKGNEECSVELQGSAGESEYTQPLDAKEPVNIPDEEKQVNDMDNPYRIENSDSDESTEQVGMSFVSGMSDIQRETLSKRYPNIFKGLSFVKQNKMASQSRTDSDVLMDDKQEKTIAGDLNLPRSLIATPEIDVIEPASRNTARGLKTTLAYTSKPGIEIERIRKYQEQLLQKQKWLKNRQDVLQKRHKDMLSEFAQDDVKSRESGIHDSSTATAGLSLSANAGSLQAADKPVVTPNGVKTLKEKHSSETQLEFEFSAARMTDADGVLGDRMSNKDDVGTGLEEEAPANPLEPLGTNMELAIDSSKERVFWESEIHTIQDEKELGVLDEGDAENIVAVREGYGMKTRDDSSSGRHSNFDGLQNLLSEIDSIHLQANATAVETNSLDPPSTGAMKRSHRMLAGKPAFSPIQEVEETPYKERSIVTSQNPGTASVSSLVEQELPPSTRSSSEINHFSPIRSSKSNERSEISAAFSLRELVSSLSETEFLSFPNQVPVRDTKGQLPERYRQRSTGSDGWTPLQPYHSAPKDDEAPSRFRHPDHLQESGDVAIEVGHKSELDFDKEKYKRLVQEHLYIPTVSLGDFDVEDVDHKQTRSSDLIEMGSLQEQLSDLAGIDELRLPEMPQISSRNSREQRSGTSMRETNAISLSSTSSSKLSKGSSTNMSKYEEVLEHVRMLPYKYLEEYNKLSESYQSWRKETVEPLLQPEIPEYFGGYEIFANRELDFDRVSPVSELQSRFATSSDLAFQPLHTSHIDSEPENTTGLKADAQELMPPRIHLHEPVVDFEFYDEVDEFRNGRSTRRGGKNDEETKETIFAEGNVPLHTSQVFIENTESLDGNFLPLISKIKEQGCHDDFLTEKDVSLHSDQLKEQKFSETVSEIDLQDESLYLERHEAVASVGKRETANGSKDWRFHEIDTEIKIVPPDKELALKHYDQPHSEIVKQSTSDIEFKALPRRFLEPYISSFGSSSATKSLLTSSPSRKSKSFLSSGLRSDETVSELARLWSRDDEEDEESMRARNSQKSSSSGIHGSSTSSTSAPTRSEKILIKRNESLTDHSIAFKDPNNYDISLFKSTSSKASKSQDGQLLSDKSDDSSNLPTVPKFASTLLVNDQPFLEAQKSASPSVDIERSLHESLDADPFRAAVEGHSDTSWLLPPEALKELSDGNITSENGLDENTLAVGNVHSLDSSENPPFASKDSPVSGSSLDDHSVYKSTQRWDELLSAQISGSSAKESDGELPEVLKLKKEAFIRRSQQRVQQSKRKSAKNDHQHTNNDHQHTKNDHQRTKYRVDGRVETKHGKKPDKENKNPTSMKTVKNRMGKKTFPSSGGKPNARNKSHSSSQSDENSHKHEEVLQENRRRVQQFQKKIQSSLRNRRK